MLISRSHFRRCPFTLAAVVTAGIALTAINSPAESPKKPKAKQAPERIVVTDDAAPAPNDARVVRLDAVPRGRAPMAQDASGTRRGPDEPRMITGSFIPQRFDVYGNVTTAGINLRLYTPGDLSTGKGMGNGLFGGGARAGSYTDKIERIGNRYVLDLRRVAPEQRLEVASSLLGADRGRQFVTDFDRWEAAQGKPLAQR